ncbi:MAG: leucine-rich repeat domain-containing protein, partial [Promethearchaeota archaeon]
MEHYQNIPLVLEEAKVLKRLEELAKTPIFHVTGTNFFEGFVAEKGHVVKLGIVRKPLRRFPEIIFQLPYLRTLLLEHTTLKKVPKGIGTLVHLEKLSFSCNEIVNLPEELGNCRNINYLDISHNKLREIPKTLINLNKLSFLVIEDNAINVSQSFETILVFKRQKCEIERDNAFNWTNVKLLRS